MGPGGTGLGVTAELKKKFAHVLAKGERSSFLKNGGRCS